MSLAKRLIEDKSLRKKLLPGIRNKRLIELCILQYALFYDETMGLSKSLIAKACEKGIFPNKAGMVAQLVPSDVIEILGCTEAEDTTSNLNSMISFFLLSG